MGMSLIRSSQVVAIRDEDHAVELLRECRVSVTDNDQLRRLARHVFEGRFVLVRREGPVEFDDLADVADDAPLLTELILAG